MGFIAGFFRWLWTLARVFWPFAGSGQMFRGAGTLWTFLFFQFCIVFAVPGYSASHRLN